MMPCSAFLTLLLAARLLILTIYLAQETGSFPMELEFAVQGTSGISTEPEGRWWCFFFVEEVEWMESTTVRYQIQ